MYSTCLFCNGSLGTNEAIEHFPVGRRLAFDAAKGRLWVVCRECERWNLTPLEERWEAIEEAERLFSDSRLRVSTSNIGLAKLRDGTTLIRIGSALQPEIAAWRYGDQFGRRRRKHIALTALGVGAVATVAIAGPATGLIAGGGWGLWQGMNAIHNVYQWRRIRVRLRSPDGETVIPIRKQQLDQTSIIRMEDDSWALRIASGRQRGKQAMELRPETILALYTGPEALRAAARLFPAVNESGAKKEEVQSAVQMVADAGDPEQLFQRYASNPSAPSRYRAASGEIFNAHRIAHLPKEVRLALEMAAHEEQERRALEGELAILEAAWRDAEEVAKIADDMFVTDDLTTRIEGLRKKD
ncbi:MAG TPA: hypothetical protein VEB19_09685 [Gemmatimonadaceae bacterium]|nr:hypothetical protein [Gemmatimonadaceae bacterium]